jgi:hypothetical protein
MIILIISSLNCSLFQLLNRKSTFEVLYSDINSLKSGLLHLMPSLRVEEKKSKMDLEAKVLGTISLIDAGYANKSIKD